FNIFYIDVFNSASSSGVGLYPYGPLKIRAAHFTVAHINITYATRYLASNYHSPMTILHNIIFDYNILTFNANPTPIIITTRFYGDAIITCIKNGVLDVYILAVFGIAPVIVGPMTVNSYPVNRNIT